MNVLALDPGAKRMGYALLEHGPIYQVSGIIGLERGNESYHAYRLNLINYFEEWADNFLAVFDPDVVVSELLPVKGFRDMSQALLAATAITTVQTVAMGRNVVVAQVPAQTVKMAMTGVARATKVKVRNGVVDLLPELEPKRMGSWTKEFDEPDAIAVGLTYLGYENTPT